MPAWIAGIQVRRMRPETSMSIWVPALHGERRNRGTFAKVYPIEPGEQRNSEKRRMMLRVVTNLLVFG